jgi:hypothetical protein
LGVQPKGEPTKKVILTTATLIFFSTTSFANDPKTSLAALKATLEKMGAPSVEGSVKVGDKDIPQLKFGPRPVNNN